MRRAAAKYCKKIASLRELQNRVESLGEAIRAQRWPRRESPCYRRLIVSERIGGLRELLDELEERHCLVTFEEPGGDA